MPKDTLIAPPPNNIFPRMDIVAMAMNEFHSKYEEDEKQ